MNALAISGVSLVLATMSNVSELLCTTGSRIGEVEKLQVTIGEGPGIDVLSSGRPVLVDDLYSSSSTRRWPVFVAEARQLGMHAVYSLPLAMGAIRVGTLNLYNDVPLELSRDQLVDALSYADTALLLVLHARSGITIAGDGGIQHGGGQVLRRAELHQAAGVVSTQLGVSVLDALVRLRSYAYRHDQQLMDVARAVVQHRLPSAEVADHYRSIGG